MKKLSGFSLMEMMVVLLIVSIVAAASAPMINKRMVIAASEKSSSPWVRVDANTIAYNLSGSNLQTALVGTMTSKSDADSARFYIESDDSTPQIAFGQKNDQTVMKLLAGDSSLHLSDSVDANNFSSSRAQTVIGYKARTSNNTSNSVAVGYGANASGNNSIALGVGTGTQGTDSIAIGWSTFTNANAQRAVVIGSGLNIAAPNSVSIGSGSASGTNSIAIGGGWSDRFADRTSARSLNSIAIGVGANAYIPNTSTVGNNLAIGSNVTTYSQDSLVIGSNSEHRSNSANSILIGSNNLSMPGVSSQIGIGRDIDIGSYTNGHSYGHGISNTIAIGNSIRPSTASAIAIGSNVNASFNSIAIGTNAATANRVNGKLGEGGGYSTAIGWGAKALNANSTAIGKLAETTASNQIVLGTANDTVYIPGNLFVAGDVLLGTKGHTVYAYMHKDGINNGAYFKFNAMSDGNKVKTDAWWRNGIPFGGTTYNSGDSFSDRRLKNVGKVFAGGLAEIKKLEVFNYTFKADESKTPRVGVMAQDLQKIFPNAVTKGEDGFLRIRMEDMFYALVNAVKENDSRITALEKENIALKKQNIEFQKRLTELEKKVNAGK